MINFPLFWQRRGIANILLLPLAALYAVISHLRRLLLLATQVDSSALPPIIVVGNIVAGGSGKTPIVIALAQQLAARGWQPGIISRGYGGKTVQDTLLLNSASDWRQCGDEPLLIHLRTTLPVCVAKKRLLAAQRLAQEGCNILISDDGLQHYAMPRQVEICVSNARYRFGNGWRLPAGPLREAPQRAKQCAMHLLVGADSDTADTIAVNKTIHGIANACAPQHLYCAADLHHISFTAIAGTAHPQEFFNMLKHYGVKVHKTIALPDHGETALAGISGNIIMTEKDLIKYPADDRLYALVIDCNLPDKVIRRIEQGVGL